MINEAERLKRMSFSGKVYVNDGGVAGTTFPLGTPTNPVSNIADALTIAATRNIRHFHIYGTFGAITETLSGYWIEGHVGPLGAPFLTLAAGVANVGTTFNRCMITGAANGWAVYENNCLLTNLTGVQGLIQNGNLNGTIKLGSGITNFDRCATIGGPITLDIDDIAAGSCIMHNIIGTVTLANLDTAGTIKIYSGDGANITIANTCIAGIVNIYGNCNVTDNSGAGCTVNDYTIYTRTKGLDDIHDDLVVVSGYTDPTVAGRVQVLEVSVTSAANAAADTVLATVATQPCLIEGVITRADAIQTTDLSSCPIKGGTAKVLTFINAGNATQPNLDAIGKQVRWGVLYGTYLAVGETLVMEHNGVGATALNLTVIIVYRATANGGTLS